MICRSEVTVMKDGSPLKRRRMDDERKLTQEKVAEALGIFPTYYAEIESGRRRPGLGLLLRIAEFWGMTVDEVIRGFKVDETSNCDEPKEDQRVDDSSERPVPGTIDSAV
jgi:transcriptional regulator with XRE-family HTH domain